MRLLAEVDARRVVGGMALIVAMAIAAGAVRNVVASREHRLSWIREAKPIVAARPSSRSPVKPAAPANAFAPHPDTPYVELTANDVEALYERKTLFIDARRTSVYEEGHIAGARSMPVGESDIKDRLMAIASESRDVAEPIVLYCNGGHCGDSYDLAERLWGVGFNNLYIYKDGFPDWVKRARPVRSGSAP